MITASYVTTMARYNAWQNRSVYAAAESLSDEERGTDRGAFFGSIQGTLSHILWGDRMWMHRFDGLEKPGSPITGSADYISDWSKLKEERLLTDQAILDWSLRVDPDWLAGALTWYSSAVEREISRDTSMLVAHFFNHQTHHRGQVHAMLTAAGARPDDTDLMLMEDGVPAA